MDRVRRPSVSLDRLEQQLLERGFEDFRWIEAQRIAVAAWVRAKCRWGCPEYGRRAVCPPAVPDLEHCERLIGEYRDVAVIHFESGEQSATAERERAVQMARRLLDLERGIFLSGFRKALVLLPERCRICESCPPDPLDCSRPVYARPSATALGVDVLGTVERIGYPAELSFGKDEIVNRYAFLLVR
ncbi:MAG: DUF2284 domain-containing protein [Polyangia bacterium]